MNRRKLYYGLLALFCATGMLALAARGTGLKTRLLRMWYGEPENCSPNIHWSSAVHSRGTKTAILNAGHIQGVAVAPGYFYLFHTAMIEKYDSKWKLLGSNQDVFAGLPTNHGIPNHLGDGAYQTGKLFVPAESGFLGNGQFIAVYDATAPNLPLIGYRDITSQHHEVSGMTVVPQDGPHGVIYVSSFFADVGGGKLWMYDYQDGDVASSRFGEYLGTLDIPPSIQRIQGVKWHDGYFYFSNYENWQIDRVRRLGAALDDKVESVYQSHAGVQGLDVSDSAIFLAIQIDRSTEYIQRIETASLGSKAPGKLTKKDGPLPDSD